jgi:hypothetical protein
MNYDTLLSSFAFNLKLRRYTMSPGHLVVVGSLDAATATDSPAAHTVGGGNNVHRLAIAAADHMTAGRDGRAIFRL